MKAAAALSQMLGPTAEARLARWPGFVVKVSSATWLLDQWNSLFTTELRSGGQIHVSFEPSAVFDRLSRIKVSFEGNEFAVLDTAMLPAGPIRDHTEGLIRVLTPLARKAAAEACKV